jgi:hypothetical protein
LYTNFINSRAQINGNRRLVLSKDALSTRVISGFKKDSDPLIVQCDASRLPCSSPSKIHYSIVYHAEWRVRSVARIKSVQALPNYRSVGKELDTPAERTTEVKINLPRDGFFGNSIRVLREGNSSESLGRIEQSGGVNSAKAFRNMCGNTVSFGNLPFTVDRRRRPADIFEITLSTRSRSVRGEESESLRFGNRFLKMNLLANGEVYAIV